MANSADPDQLASSTDLVLHCLQNSVFLGSAGQWLRNLLVSIKSFFTHKLYPASGFPITSILAVTDPEMLQLHRNEQEMLSNISGY